MRRGRAGASASVVSVIVIVSCLWLPASSRPFLLLIQLKKLGQCLGDFSRRATVVGHAALRCPSLAGGVVSRRFHAASSAAVRIGRSMRRIGRCTVPRSSGWARFQPAMSSRQ
jgi:hypothetical protein